MKSLSFNAVLATLALLLVACGGGGGGSAAPSAAVFSTVAVNAAPVADSIASDQSHYYELTVYAGQNLTIRLDTQAGDADLGLYSGDPLDPNNLIDFSINPDLVPEIMSYSVPQDTVLYIEIYGFLASRYTLQVTAPDLPPVISAFPPASVQEGSQFSFTAMPFDPDNPSAAFSYEVLYGPSGMQIDTTGHVTWLAHGAVFSTASDVHYAIRATTGGVHVDFTGTVTVLDPAQPLPLLRGGLLTPLREGGFVSADFDNDGIDEILVTNHDKHVYLMEESGGSYRQTWMQPIDYTRDGVVGSIAAADLDGDNYPEIIIGSSRWPFAHDLTEARISIIDGRTRALLLDQSAGPNAFTVQDMQVLDTDNDGQLEIVALVQTFSPAGLFSINILDAGTLALEWQSPNLTGTILATGNLDADTYPEIATSGGYVYAFNGSNYVLKWNHGSSFGRSIRIADIDADGTAEIVSDTSVYSLPALGVLWSIPQGSFSYRALHTTNLDADAAAEIILGEDQSGDLVVFEYNGVTDQVEETSRHSMLTGTVRSIESGQLDSDPDPEIIWSANISPSTRGLAIATFASGWSQDWDSSAEPALGSPFIGAHMTTLAPGDRRAVFITPRTDGGGGTRLVTLTESGTVVINGTDLGSNWANAAAMVTSDYDGDSVEEILFSSADLYSGFLAVHSFLGDVTEWTSPPDIGTSRTLAAHDMNDDLAADLITLNYNSELQVYDVLHDTLLTTVTLPADIPHDMLVTNMDADSAPEVVLLHGDTVYIFGPDGMGGLLEERSMTLSPAISTFSFTLDAGDLDGDAVPEVVLVNSSTSAAEIFVLDNSLNLLATSSVNDEVSDIIMEPATGGRRNVILAMHRDNRSWLAWTDAMTGTVVSASPELVGRVQKNSLHVTDLNADSQPDFVIGTDRGMYLSR